MDRLDKENLEVTVVRMLEGSLTDSEKKSLIMWLDESAANRAEFRKILSLCNIPNMEKIAKIDLYEAESQVLSRTSGKCVSRWKSILVNTAAVLALPLAVSTIFLSLSKDISPESHMIETHVPMGARSKIILPDSSIVHLNSGSGLTYASAFNDSTREVYLEGEGYFEVRASEKSPFVVKTDNFNVRCTGTEFNIRAYASDPEQSVTLVDGKIQIEIDDARISLNPNDRMTVTQDGAYKITCEDPYRYYAWKNGELAFRNNCLEEVLQMLSNTYNYEFVLMDDSLKKYSVHATFKNETIHEMVALLECILPVKCRFSPPANTSSLGTIEIWTK